jgi:mono/diheme cytochrome c family protein
VAPPLGATADYGEYIVSYAGCRDCHGANLSGGGGGLTPAGPNLGVVTGWTQDQFITTMRTGVDPGGHALDPRQMPWESVGKLDDVELVALYEYLRSLLPSP